LKEAVDSWHQAQETLQRMQALSRQVIFETVPSPSRRKLLRLASVNPGYRSRSFNSRKKAISRVIS
jgi:hypothetical protein